MILRAGERRLELGGRPLLMGILNATPDSFSDGSDDPLDVRVERGRALIEPVLSEPGMTRIFTMAI